ncbi:MAG: lytic transglycosylase domain-containing protein [Firmicutes bacterium]|nr:lytic transglycosylase domain-containing protein [Bacillota bacterium]
MRYRILTILIMTVLFLCHKPVLKAFFILEYKEYIANYCRQYQVNPTMISALVFTESRFDTGAQSHKGALGLMQIMPSTGGWVAEKLMWRDFSPEDLLDPQTNLKAGIWYMAYLKKLFNHNEYLALASYNAGSRYVTKWIADGIWDGNVVKIEQIPFAETKKYVLKIIVVQKIYSYLYPELLSMGSNRGMNAGVQERQDSQSTGKFKFSPAVFLGVICQK